MSAMDEFKEERDSIKKQPLKKRLSYFWTYYKWYVICTVFALVIIGGFLFDSANRTKDIFYVATVNGYPKENALDLAADFAAYAEIDTQKHSVFFNDTLYIADSADDTTVGSRQLITVYIATKNLDICIMDPDRFAEYAYEDTFMQLPDCLSPELLARLSGKIYYADAAVMRTLAERRGSLEPIDDIAIPDPFHPEKMTEPVPVGIDLSDCQKFTDAYYYEENACFLGVPLNSERLELIEKFVTYLFD